MHQTDRFPFTPFPDGIYAVSFSHELKPGKAIPVTFMGEKLALFRTNNSEVGAVESYCPHLGANLAYGTVKNDSLQCPFHGLRYKKDGSCLTKNHLGIAGAYQIKSWPVFEKYGLIFLTHNPLGSEHHINFPEWNLAEWGTPIEHCFKIKSHPQEILENSVDSLHFFQVHKYISVTTLEPLQTIGAEFSIGCQMERRDGLFGALERKTLQICLDIHAYGLGMSIVDITLPKYQLQARQIVFPTPIDAEFIHVRTLTSVKIPEKFFFVSGRIMPGLLKKQIANFLTRAAAKGFLADFLPDLNIWENKKYVAHPEYLRGDGEFEKYRKWASQFYRLQEINSIPDAISYSVPA